MKSQGLPLQTIVILVLVIVALAAILMFFFGGFGKSGASLNDQQALSKCQSRCTRAKTLASGLNFSSSSTTDASTNTWYADGSDEGQNIYNVGSYSDYCTKQNVEGIEKYCSSIMSCNVLFKNEAESCILKCKDALDIDNNPIIQVMCSSS